MHIFWLIWWLSLIQIKFVAMGEPGTQGTGTGECATASGHQKPSLCFFDCWRKGKEKKEAKASLVISLMQQQKNGWANFVALNACLLLLTSPRALDVSCASATRCQRCVPSILPLQQCRQVAQTSQPFLEGFIITTSRHFSGIGTRNVVWSSTVYWPEHGDLEIYKITFLLLIQSCTYIFIDF